MPNCYCDLGMLKNPGGIITAAPGQPVTNDYDSMLLMWAENASRFIDNYCKQPFYTWEGAKVLPGAGRTVFLPTPLLSVSAFALDLDGSGTYSTALAPTDYVLQPTYQLPYYTIVPSQVTSVGSFASSNPSGIKITGVWGFGTGETATPYYDSGITATCGATGAITLSVSGIVFPGMTIRIGTEQAYISSMAGLTATAQRGVNGTAAASHATTEVYIYQYHSSVAGACLVQLSIWWQRRLSGYASKIGNSLTGEFSSFKGLDDGVAVMLDQPRLMRRAIL